MAMEGEIKSWPLPWESKYFRLDFDTILEDCLYEISTRVYIEDTWHKHPDADPNSDYVYYGLEECSYAVANVINDLFKTFNIDMTYISPMVYACRLIEQMACDMRTNYSHVYNFFKGELPDNMFEKFVKECDSKFDL